MATTRLSLKNNIASMCERPEDTIFLDFLNDRIDRMMDALYDMHDWNFKHQSDSFNTVSGTEEYELSLVTTNKNLRSSEDIEILYDKTNGRRISKEDLKSVRSAHPKEATSGKPSIYAPWGTNSIVLSDKPNGIFNMKMLYISKPIYPTTDAKYFEADCKLPEYMLYLLEKMVLTEAMFISNDNRRDNLILEIERVWKPRAIQADMKHLESTSRIKFWEEELEASGNSYDDYLSSLFRTEEY